MDRKIISVKNELENSIEIDPHLLQESIENYISLEDHTRSSFSKYHYLSDAQIDFYHLFSKKFGHNKVLIFHKIVMLELISQFPVRVKKLNIPPSIMEMFKVEFERIFQIIEKDESFIFDWSNDLFAKDMGICTLRLIPAGAQLVEISGVPRRVLFDDPRKIIQNLWFFIFKTRGFKPFYEIHTHLGNLSEFHPDGWHRCYVRIGELLRMNPKIKGMQGGSWFYDPALSEISPRLEYLRSVPCSNGAKIFFLQEEGGSSSALSKSETRKQLYVEGKYLPKSYLLVWARDDLIHYSERDGGEI